MNPTLLTAAAALAAAACIGAQAAGAAQGDGEPITVTRAGTVPSAKGAVPNNYSGSVRVDMLHTPKQPWRTSAAYVTFEPGARTVWHTHPVGQTLIVNAGAGLVQRVGGPIETIRPGDVVWIPAGVKHWHGAAPSTGMTHIAVTEMLNGKAVDWLEPVSEAQYAP
jgi:quercetin dioxygenase-like cupin family protein